MIEIRPASGPADIAAVRGLFEEYAAWLESAHDVRLDFQGFAAEVAGLPGQYAPPGGALLLAAAPEGVPQGCVALRPFRDATCEIKRLYVRPAARGAGLGGRLAQRILDAATALGYTRALLDTAGFMTGALRVYEALGFRDVAAYYANPYPGMRYLGRDLG